MPNIYSIVAAVRFTKIGKLYHFDASNFPELKIGDPVIVETTRGWQIGQVAQIFTDLESSDATLKPIERPASPRDLLLRQTWKAKESDIQSLCNKRVSELRISGAKIVDAEYSFDGTRLTIFFVTETEEKVDLKSLRQDMQKSFTPAQVELRQVGPRDVAKLLCGMGACGLETRCCSKFLCEFSSISIRMAKEQGISLTPSEITGMCGRLRCCLIYEFETYVNARKNLPKRNKHVKTPDGEGKVVDVNPLRGSVIVQLNEETRREFMMEAISVLDDNQEKHMSHQGHSDDSSSAGENE